MVFHCWTVFIWFCFGSNFSSRERTVIVSDSKEIGKNLGKLGAYDAAGWVLGPAIAAALNAINDFRTPFWGMAIALTFFIPTALKAKPDQAERDLEKKDRQIYFESGDLMAQH